MAVNPLMGTLMQNQPGVMNSRLNPVEQAFGQYQQKLEALRPQQSRGEMIGSALLPALVGLAAGGNIGEAALIGMGGAGQVYQQNKQRNYEIDQLQAQATLERPAAAQQYELNQAAEMLTLAQARAEMASGQYDEDALKALNQIGDDFRKEAGDYLIIRRGAQNVLNASANAAGDMALIFSYMKMLDPNSTVREGEYATAEAAAGVPAVER